MKALQLTERRQKDADKRYNNEHEKNDILSRLISRVTSEITS